MAFRFRSFRFRSESKNGPSLVVDEGHLQEHAREQPGDLMLRLRNPPRVTPGQDRDPSANETDGTHFAIFGPAGHTKLRSRLVILSFHLGLKMPSSMLGPWNGFNHRWYGLNKPWYPSTALDSRTHPLHSRSFHAASPWNATRRGLGWEGSGFPTLCCEGRHAHICSSQGRHLADQRQRGTAEGVACATWPISGGWLGCRVSICWGVQKIEVTATKLICPVPHLLSSLNPEFHRYVGGAAGAVWAGGLVWQCRPLIIRGLTHGLRSFLVHRNWDFQMGLSENGGSSNYDGLSCLS